MQCLVIAQSQLKVTIFSLNKSNAFSKLFIYVISALYALSEQVKLRLSQFYKHSTTLTTLIFLTLKYGFLLNECFLCLLS